VTKLLLLRGGGGEESWGVCSKEKLRGSQKKKKKNDRHAKRKGEIGERRSIGGGPEPPLKEEKTRKFPKEGDKI